MWILPKQLISDFVPDTEALSLDCDEQSKLCAQSLYVRSKHSQSRTWSQKWKRDFWTQHLYGRILKLSLGKAFEIAWTSSLEVIPANHSVQQEGEQEKMILDIYGPSSQAEFDFFDQESVFLKTSKDISRWGCPTSLKTWPEWVTERRGAYSQRAKSARLTRGKECSSWPTASARDWKGCYSEHAMIRKDGKMRGDLLPDAVRLAGSGLSLPTNAKGIQRRDASVLNVETITQNANAQGQRRTDTNMQSSTEFFTQGPNKHGPPAPASSSSHGNRPESWATPQARDHKGSHAESFVNPNKSNNLNDQMETLQTAGKLNPRWVETLMGLPIGWTMPSCSQPVTIASMNCDSSGTELCQQQQSELFEC